MVAAWRPDLSIQVPFNSNPNDPSVVPLWTDLSNLFTGADAVTRGRQYELDQNQASQPTIDWLDPNEYLNPANTESPNYPDVLPLRQLLWQGVWPNPASGNLLNANQPASSILGTTAAGYDPTFDSYAVNSVPGWCSAIGGVAIKVDNTSPHSGANDMFVPTTAGSSEQGVAFTVPTMPNRQYTASVWVRQSVANTAAIGVGGLSESVDGFNRTVASGWGADSLAQAWTTAGGSASDYNVIPGSGMHALNSVAASRQTMVGAANADVDMVVYLSVDQLATGGLIRTALTARWTNTSNYYFATLDMGTDQSVTLSIIKRVAGTETTLASQVMTFQAEVDGVFGLRFTLQGTSLSASAWQQYTQEPTSPTITTTDSALTAGGQVGCYSRLATGNTNTLPVNASFENFGGYCTVVGGTTTTTGSYVRLTQTFTASQPTHTIQVATVGTVLTGNIRVDDIQLEQAATASTFTTTGSTIYGIFRGNVERWPSEWDYQGFLGLTNSTAVDAFEALNLFTLKSEYQTALLSLEPDYYWPLNDAANSTTFGEQSGNNGPPLKRIDAKAGPASTFEAGQPIEFPGDPDAVGLSTFSTSVTGSLASPVGTLPGSGLVLGAAKTCSVTAAFWVSHSGSFTTNLATANPAFSVFQTVINTEQVLFGFGGNDVPPNQYTILTQGFSSPNGLFNDTEGDGNPHLYVMVITYDVGGTHNEVQTVVYIDGGPSDTVSEIAPITPPYFANSVQIGGAVNPATGVGQAGWPNATYAHVALWNRALSSAEVAFLWTAGGLGNAGEFSGTRIARLVGEAWTGPTNIDLGSSQMGVSTVTTGQTVLSACQAVAVTEQGNFFVDKDGQVVFAGRSQRYLNTTSRWTFGENTAGGEFPYLGDIEFDFDPTFIFNTTNVDNADGVNATVTAPNSIQQYYPRSTTVAADTFTDDQAVQLGYWITNKHQQPTQRIQTISFNVAAYSPLWPVVLSMEIDDRVTVVRRASGANGGTGLTMSGDFFIENISHTGIDLTAGTWTTTLLLSPAVDSSSVFIFDDATYGVFDGPGVFAY